MEFFAKSVQNRHLRPMLRPIDDEHRPKVEEVDEAWAVEPGLREEDEVDSSFREAPLQRSNSRISDVRLCQGGASVQDDVGEFQTCLQRGNCSEIHICIK